MFSSLRQLLLFAIVELMVAISFLLSSNGSAMSPSSALVKSAPLCGVRTFHYLSCCSVSDSNSKILQAGCCRPPHLLLRLSHCLLKQRHPLLSGAPMLTFHQTLSAQDFRQTLLPAPQLKDRKILQPMSLTGA